MSIKVNIYRTFREDQRISMDMYAYYLDHYIKKNYNSVINLSSFTPKMMISKFLPSKLKMRFARFIEYPYQIRKNYQKYEINHIIDHGYSHLIRYPLNKKNTIVTVHDIIPILAWRGFIPNFRYPNKPRLVEYSINSLKNAAHIIAVSQNTKKDLIEHCGIKNDNISVIYNGCNSSFKPLQKSQREQLRNNKFKFPRDSFLMLITGEGYKNHETTLKILKELRSKKKNIYLVRLGPKNQNWENLKNYFSLNQYIIEFSGLELNVVSELYTAVDCLLFPSWYEGFGFPPLEAMANGLPVVASNVSSIPEVVGDAGLLYNPDDIEGMIKGITSIMNDKKTKDELINKGIKQSSLFTWENSIKKLINVYRSVINNNYPIKK